MIFTGSAGKALVIKQGYVPPTCTLPNSLAGLLVMAEESKGRNACWGCNHDRMICKGEPKQPEEGERP